MTIKSEHCYLCKSEMKDEHNWCMYCAPKKKIISRKTKKNNDIVGQETLFYDNIKPVII